MGQVLEAIANLQGKVESIEKTVVTASHQAVENIQMNVCVGATGERSFRLLGASPKKPVVKDAGEPTVSPRPSSLTGRSPKAGEQTLSLPSTSTSTKVSTSPQLEMSASSEGTNPIPSSWSVDTSKDSCSCECGYSCASEPALARHLARNSSSAGHGRIR